MHTANDIAPAPANHCSFIIKCFASNCDKSEYGETRAASIVTTKTIITTATIEIVDVLSKDAIFFNNDNGNINMIEYNATTNGLLQNIEPGYMV